MSYIWMGRRGRGGQYLAPLVFLARLREGWEKIYDEIGQIGKGPEDSLNLIKIKNPFRYLKTQADAWWVRFFGFKKHVFLVHTSKKASTLLILTTDIIIDHIENTIQGKQISWHEHISYSELVSWCFCQVHLILLISISNLKLYPVLFIFINSIHIHQSIQIHFIHLNPFSSIFINLIHLYWFSSNIYPFSSVSSILTSSHLFSFVFIYMIYLICVHTCSKFFSNFKMYIEFHSFHQFSSFIPSFILYFIHLCTLLILFISFLFIFISFYRFDPFHYFLSMFLNKKINFQNLYQISSIFILYIINHHPLSPILLFLRWLILKASPRGLRFLNGNIAAKISKIIFGNKICITFI